MNDKSENSIVIIFVAAMLFVIVMKSMSSMNKMEKFDVVDGGIVMKGTDGIRRGGINRRRRRRRLRRLWRRRYTDELTGLYPAYGGGMIPVTRPTISGTSTVPPATPVTPTTVKQEKPEPIVITVEKPAPVAMNMLMPVIIIAIALVIGAYMVSRRE